MNYVDFFARATAREPYPYQCALAEGPWPELVDVPTGLGKTAAIGVAWLYRRSQGDRTTPRRLVWCLPMRSLVEQTCREFRRWIEHTAELFEVAPTVNMLMGGHRELAWAEHPERDAVVVGTQDMLMSRALMRGYGMSRYAWPLHYAWLHNDALWVFDETQLMGVTVPTSAQLAGLRGKLGTAAPARSIWMSATLSDAALDTVDHRSPEGGRPVHRLGERDLEDPAVTRRVEAQKALERFALTLDRDSIKSGAGLDALADAIVEAHIAGSLSLVVVNRVGRAQALFERVRERAGDVPVALLHSRFRPADRREQAKVLDREGGRIVIATQVVEAGVDVSARVLFTELAPWPSLVQRFGRCNRYGECDDARVVWIDLAPADEKDGDVLLPYTFDALDHARAALEGLSDVGPASVRGVAWEPEPNAGPVLRRRDVLELFDTTPDLSGNDLDVSRYIREGDDTDVSFYWRQFDGAPPATGFEAPDADELCRVSIGQARDFVGKKNIEAWRFDALEKRWQKLTKQSGPRPGEVILIESSTGGYDPQLGFIGHVKKPRATQPVEVAGVAGRDEAMDDDPKTYTGVWLSLEAHTENVVEQVERLCEALGLEARWRGWLVSAARWHDLGKAHPAFQERLLTPAPGADSPPADPNVLWAKSDHRRGTASRPNFRHELASALAWLQFNAPGHETGERETGERDTNAVAYLIAAHHGKVRLSIRSLPGERRPSGDTLFARGVWHGDRLPPADLGGGVQTDAIELDLGPMRLGAGSWLERCLALRDAEDLGPFRLAYLESLLRIADQRASALEQQRARAQEPSPARAPEPQEVP